MPVSRKNKVRHRVKTVRKRTEARKWRAEKEVDPKPEELKNMDLAIEKDDVQDWTTLKITRPANCHRESLDLRALDSHTRKLAGETFITVEGKRIPCLGFKVMDDGVLRLDVHPEAFQFG